MNLSGLSGNGQWAIETFGNGIRDSIIKNGHDAGFVLLSIGRELRRMGFEVNGSVRNGFIAKNYNTNETIEIEVVQL